MSRFLPRSKNLRIALYAAASIVFVAVVAGLLVNSASSGPKHSAAKHKVKARPAPPGSAVTLAVGPVVVQNTGPPASVSAPIRLALMRATQKYLDDAIQAPLLHGQVNNAYTSVFDPGVKGPATLKDRAALTESATGVIRQPIRISATPVRIDGLGDPTGKLALAATTFTLHVTARTPVGHLTIVRNTELTFANESGRWIVTAYQVGVVRTVGPNTTTTTAHAGTVGTTA